MARTTPTYTPIRNYAIGFLLSVFFLFCDISYGSFSQIRGSVNAISAHFQIITHNIFSTFDDLISSFNQNEDLLKENKILKNQISEMKIMSQIEKIYALEKLEELNLYKDVSIKLSKKPSIHKIAYIDIRNYLCCSSHTIFLQNPQKIKIQEHLPVIAGETFIGQTTKNYLDLIEVMLFSDTSHILPVKSNSFFCNAKGRGKPLTIFCKLDENLSNFNGNVGDNIFTSGLGGVFTKDIEIGLISDVNSTSPDEVEVIIKLKANPIEENFYAIINTIKNES